jgi:hypothetical protein
MKISDFNNHKIIFIKIIGLLILFMLIYLLFVGSNKYLFCYLLLKWIKIKLLIRNFYNYKNLMGYLHVYILFHQIAYLWKNLIFQIDKFFTYLQTSNIILTEVYHNNQK